MESKRIVRTVVRIGQQPTETRIQEIERASALPVTSDKDAPELTAAQYAETAQLARQRRSGALKSVVTLRVSPATLEKARASGSDDTGFLSRLLDNAINDPQLVSRSM